MKEMVEIAGRQTEMIPDCLSEEDKAILREAVADFRKTFPAEAAGKNAPQIIVQLLARAVEKLEMAGPPHTAEIREYIRKIEEDLDRYNRAFGPPPESLDPRDPAEKRPLDDSIRTYVEIVVDGIMRDEPGAAMMQRADIAKMLANRHRAYRRQAKPVPALREFRRKHESLAAAFSDYEAELRREKS